MVSPMREHFFVLGNDIDLNPGVVFAPDGSVSSGTPQGWTPIGTEKTPFKGVFKGNGHAITGLYFLSHMNIPVFWVY